MYYWTPKRIKELKDAGYRLHFDQSSLVKKSDQAISKEPATAVEFKRSPGPGQTRTSSGSSLKRQAAGGKRHTASSAKRQASSPE